MFVKRDPNVFLFRFVYKLKFTRNFPLHSSLQSRNRSNRKMRMNGS